MKTAWLAQRPFLSEGLTQHDLLLSILIALSLLLFLYYSHLFAWHLETFEDSRHLRLRHHDRDRQGG